MAGCMWGSRMWTVVETLRGSWVDLHARRVAPVEEAGGLPDPGPVAEGPRGAEESGPGRGTGGVWG